MGSRASRVSVLQTCHIIPLLHWRSTASCRRTFHGARPRQVRPCRALDGFVESRRPVWCGGGKARVSPAREDSVSRDGRSSAAVSCLELGSRSSRLEWHDLSLVARYTGVGVWVRQPVYTRYGAVLYRVLEWRALAKANCSLWLRPTKRLTLGFPLFRCSDLGQAFGHRSSEPQSASRTFCHQLLAPRSPLV